MSSEKEQLFSEFPNPSPDDWQLDSSLNWKTEEGLRLAPAYRQSDIQEPKKSKLYTDNGNNGWEIRQNIQVEDTSSANQRALDALISGATSIGFIGTGLDVKGLLKNTQLPLVSVSFSANDGIATLKALSEMGEDVSGCIEGNCSISETKELVVWCIETLPKYRCIDIRVDDGLAKALADGNNYLAILTKQGLNIDDITARIQFTFNIGTSYFMEIAKLCAARLLWARIVEQYKPKQDVSRSTFIHCEINPASDNKEKDRGNAFISATTRLMSAAIGDADSISIPSNGDGFTDRINRNIQLIAKQEAFLSHVADPAKGSYYLEVLTDKVAEKSWELFTNLLQE